MQMNSLPMLLLLEIKKKLTKLIWTASRLIKKPRYLIEIIAVAFQFCGNFGQTVGNNNRLGFHKRHNKIRTALRFRPLHFLGKFQQFPLGKSNNHLLVSYAFFFHGIAPLCCIFYARMRQKRVSGEAPLSEVSAAADSLMVSVRIAIRRTSLCAPTGSHFCPEWGCRAVWQHFTLCVKL